MLDNSYYLEALVHGDSSIIKLLYSKVLPRVVRFVYQNKGSEDNAREVFQDALLQLAVRYKKDQFIVSTSFEAYLFTVCKNLWRRELNRNKIEVTNHKVIELKDSDDDKAYAILEQKQWELFNSAREQLSENCKMIIKLFFERMSYAHMVAVLNYKSELVVRQRVFKCKAKLKSLIRNDKRYHDLRDL